MRIITTLISILYLGTIHAQDADRSNLYQKISGFYQQNPDRLEIVRQHHKNVFQYDTTISSFYFLPLEKKGSYLFFADSSYTITGGIHSSDKYYVLNADSPERILTKEKYVKHRYQYVPALHGNSVANLIRRFGNIISVTKKDNKFIAITTKCILEVDALTYRLVKLSEMVIYKKDYHQYDDFYYLELPDSIQRTLKAQATTLIQASIDFPVITLKELDKRETPPENNEGRPFAFSNLVSLNKGSLDTLIKNKYLIIDFFYQACLPCHKMTGYIINWLPSIDSSKIILIGINPFDSEKSMRAEVEKRGINYPIVLGETAKAMSKKYVRGYPTLLLISPEGIIKIVHFGMSKSFLAKAEKIISQ